MIVTRKLTKIYPGNVKALVDVSVAVPDGDFAFLVGPNGAGKSTLFKMMIRQETATSGCILMEGKDVGMLRAKELARHRRLVGAVFQEVRLLPTKTVAENIALPLQTEGIDQVETDERTSAALFLSGLEEIRDRFPDELSGGQRQQVAIARALVNRPKIILADEPTGNLSPAATERIMHLLSVINGCGITVVVATHNREVVDAMNRRVLVLDRGMLVADTARSTYPTTSRAQAA